ncbi:MAG: glycoside hydrolase TIM-barrel-like domain-containing protein [Alphaproteobacteria bacterium]
MAELILSTIGQAIGGRVAPAAFAAVAAQIGRFAGATLGRSIDERLFGTTRRYAGPRLTDLHVQGSTEGASIPAIYGRVRIAGQVIWAARFKERAETHDVGGGKGGPRATSTDYTYSLSFAVGLCEGEIARIGRAWANGEPFDLSQITYRVHTGAEDQAPDALIEAIEGADDAPAYRGLAYIVFEDLPLDGFGNTIPQLSFEIIRPTPSHDDAPTFEQRVRAVCLIPGAGEFVYATAPIERVMGPGQEAPENVHAEKDRANLLVSLDQLAADFPNCEWVMLVVAWFGDDLRCGECEIRPGVEIADKTTTPQSWRAGSITRDSAHLISTHDGAPAFGGTPSDASVISAIQELSARGYKVGLYPFLLMDVPAGNALPDPYGGAAQAAYPWRGRITLHPAAGHAGTPDKTSAATTQISTFFGSAAPSDFGGDASAVTYSGPSEWSYRRFVLHNAKLAALAGGVDAFLIGSELRGVSTARDSATNFPAIAQLTSLAADVRVMLPAATITYGADWSEYFGYQPNDGSGDVFFHLDPLWADSHIDVIGVDWYPPLTDWRDGFTHLDAALAKDVHDSGYLEGRIEAGEDYDFWYRSDADRTTQTRTAITDGAHAEPWIFRAKDVRNFWARRHYNRSGGVRDASPTAWLAESKPIWFTELGCPAVDKGANAPNLFVDPKSAESALPPFSSGARDDLIQRRALEAYLRYWDADAETNPTSSVYHGPMIDEAFLWAWDARPYPAFPARTDVWADGGQWRLGHWLNGRAGLGGLSDVVADICARAGVNDADTSGLVGAVSGYIVDSPSAARDALEPLMAVFDFDAGERAGRIAFFHPDQRVPMSLALDDFAASGMVDAFAVRADGAETPVETRVRFLDASRDYLVGAVSARRLDKAEGGVQSVDAPLVLEVEAAEALADRLLAAARAQNESMRFDLGPAQLALEPGDAISLDTLPDAYRITRIEDAETRRIEAQRVLQPANGALYAADPAAPPTPAHAPTPAFSVLDLPPLPGAEDDDRPLAAAFASPWLGAHDLYAGASEALASKRGRATQPAMMGELLWALWPGPVDRWDNGNVIQIKLYGGALASVSEDALLNGANSFAIESDDGEWEIVQAQNAVLVAPNTYELSRFLRGQQGSAHAMRAPHPVGTRIIALDTRLARLNIGAHEWGDPLEFIAPPAGAASTDPRAAQETETLPHAALRPWAPAHLCAAREASGDVTISWVRCARIGGDYWGPGDPPLGEPAESYQLEILDGSTLKRTVTASTGDYVYSASDQTVDSAHSPAQFGSGWRKWTPPAPLA